MNDNKGQKKLTFRLGFSRDGSVPKKFFKASVPGSVQLDYAKEYNLPDYRINDNYELYDGLENNYWFYVTTIPAGKNRFLKGKGVDYKYEIIFLNKVIYAYEGMNKSFCVRIPESETDAELFIKIYPAPKKEGKDGRSQQQDSCKQAVNYGWDFQARLIPLGIWKDVGVIYGESAIKEYYIDYELDGNRAKVTFDYKTFGGEISFSVAGKTVKSDKSEGRLTAWVDNVKKWFPIRKGEQYLYPYFVELKINDNAVDRDVGKIGFRSSELVTKPYNWEMLYECSTQAKPPITLKINGNEIFAKGSNFIMPEVFYSELNESTYRKYVNLIKDANFNIVRVWGGCSVNKEEFYDLCDENGIMVIQEFPLSCNFYSNDKKYLDTLKNEAEYIVRLLNKHPSVVCYSGGNELFEGWSGMTEQCLPIRLLNAVTYEYSPFTPFLPTLPVYGVYHGGYGFYYRGIEPREMFRQTKATAYTEFGVPSLSDKEIFDKYITCSSENMESFRNHFGLGAWGSYDESWGFKEQIESYLGKIKDLDDWIYKSQLLQTMIYKQLFEEARWQKESCSMAINWCLCDSYPCSANNSIVQCDGKVKPAYYGIKESLQDVVPIFITKSTICDEKLEYEIAILNDAETVVGGAVEIEFSQGDEKIVEIVYIKPSEKGGNSESVKAVTNLNGFNKGVFTVKLKSGELTNEYTYVRK